MKALQEEQFLGMYLAFYQTIFFAGKSTAAEHQFQPFVSVLSDERFFE